MFRAVFEHSGCVRNLQTQPVVLLVSPNCNHVVLFVFADPVPDSVLDQWLENQTGHPDGERVAVDLEIKPEALAKPPLLNPSVVFEKVDFAAERNLLSLRAIQGNAQQFAETQQDLLRYVRLLMDHHRRRLKGVEQEMRLELRSQGLKPRLGQMALQFR